AQIGCPPTRLKAAERGEPGERPVVTGSEHGKTRPQRLVSPGWLFTATRGEGMEDRLLGPLGGWGGDGRPRPLGRAMLRAWLALLLLSANRVVSRERLIDGLWGEEPPETAVKMVQLNVSRLRKLLPAGVLQTRPPGYVLEVEPEQLDLLRFERLLADARRAEPERAAPVLQAALT